MYKIINCVFCSLFLQTRQSDSESAELFNVQSVAPPAVLCGTTTTTASATTPTSITAACVLQYCTELFCRHFMENV